MIQVKNISKSFGDIKAVDQISLTIPNGIVFGMLGTNGAGKSTLLRMISGVLKADQGQILIDGIVPGTAMIHVDITVECLKEETSYVWMKLLERVEKCDRIESSKPYRLMKKIKNLIKKG